MRRSAIDRLMRRILLIPDGPARSLLVLRGSLVIAAIRCVITYAIIPAASPMIGWLGAVATPLAVVLSTAAVLFSLRGLRRVWQADWKQRWAYTAFIAVVITALVVVMVADIRTLLA